MHIPYPGRPAEPEPGRPAPVPGRPSPSRQQRILPGYVTHIGQATESDPYDRLYRQRIIFLDSTIDDDTANRTVAQLIDLAHDAEREITLRINSAGGSFSAMLAIYDTVQNIDADVRTVCLGQAEGAAAVLLAAGTATRRLVLPTAHVVLRQPSVEDTGPVQGTDVQIERDKATWLRDTVERVLAEHTGRSDEDIHRDLERPALFTAREAIDYGLADAILPRGGATPPH